jgi:hypothetical protein
VSDQLYEDKTLQLLRACFRCAKVMSKSENNKGLSETPIPPSSYLALLVGLMNNNLHQLIITFITLDNIHSRLLPVPAPAPAPAPTDEIAPLKSGESVLKEICLTMKSLCTHDDQRKEMSCAYDNGKKFLNDEVISSLLSYARNYLTHPDLAACALSALRQLILSEEAVKLVCSHGLMVLPKQILQLDHAPVLLIRSLVGLLRNLCADDERKNALVSEGIVPLLIYYMSRDEYQTDPSLMEHLLATLAAISLRSPNNSHLLVDSGGIDEIVSVMRRHEMKISLQRQACLTIRNIASRCPELRRRILDSGVEPMLRQAGRSQECIDEAYAALRDLECEVKFVKLGNDGTTFESAYESFGSSAPKFNPVFEETYDILSRIDEESRAPFPAAASASTMSRSSVFRVDEDEDEDVTSVGVTHAHDHSEHCSH